MPNLCWVCFAGRCDCTTTRMISDIWDARYLILRLPHFRSCFFEQAVLQRQISNQLLHVVHLAAQLLHLRR